VELVERPRKPAPKEVLKSWAEEWQKEGVRSIGRSTCRPKDYRFCRSGGWWNALFLGRTISRRMSRNHERLAETSEAFIYVVMSRLMARRLAR
jgi:hypothetical protein